LRTKKATDEPVTKPVSNRVSPPGYLPVWLLINHQRTQLTRCVFLPEQQELCEMCTATSRCAITTARPRPFTQRGRVFPPSPPLPLPLGKRLSSWPTALTCPLYTQAHLRLPEWAPDERWGARAATRLRPPFVCQPPTHRHTGNANPPAGINKPLV